MPILLVSCQTKSVEIIKAQDDEHLVLQLAIFKTDYDTDDPKQILLKHDSVHEFPSSRLIEDDYAKWDIITGDGNYCMEVSYFKESAEGVNLDIAIQRRMKVDEITYGHITKPVHDKEQVDTAGVYSKGKWYILGGSYNKRRGEKKGDGVYFLLRINSRLLYDISEPPQIRVIGVDDCP